MITWGACGHPKKWAQCRVCWLFFTETETDRTRWDPTHEDEDRRLYHAEADRARALARWRGREDEANAWECSWLPLGERARVEKAARDFDVAEIRDGTDAQVLESVRFRLAERQLSMHHEASPRAYGPIADLHVGHTSIGVAFPTNHYDPVTGRPARRYMNAAT